MIDETVIARCFFVLWLVCSLLSPSYGYDEGVCGTVRPPRCRKPCAPIEISLAARGRIVPGERIDVTVEVKSLVDAPQMTIDIRLPGGLRKAAGTSRWRGTLARSAVKRVSVAATVIDGVPMVVTAVASIGFPDGSKLCRAAELRLIPPGRAKALPPGPEVNRAAGARVIEHRGVER